MKGLKHIVKVREKHENWIKSGKETKFLLQAVLDETSNFSHIQGAQYFQDVVRLEIQAISNTEPSSSRSTEDDFLLFNPPQNGITTDISFNNSPVAEEAVQDHNNHHHISPWILNNGINTTELFSKYFNNVKKLIESKNLVAIETHVQDLACLNHTLVLNPNQHSKLRRENLGDDNLKLILYEQPLSSRWELRSIGLSISREHQSSE